MFRNNGVNPTTIDSHMADYNDRILRQELTEHRGDGEFDWDELDRRLGELRETGIDEAFDGQEAMRFAFALHTILDWLIVEPENLSRKHGLRSIGKRAISMAWVLNPKRFGDDASLRTLAKNLGFDAANISPLTAEFSRVFNVFNKFQKHDWRKETKHGNDTDTNRK